MKRIVLVSLPYWSPMIPPTGLAAIKQYLEKKEYKVQIIDFNVKAESLKFYYDYFDVLKKCVPEEKRGTFFNIGHEVFRTHLMMHFFCDEEENYKLLLKEIIKKWFLVRINDALIEELKIVIDTYLIVLKKYAGFIADYYEPHTVGASIYKTNLPITLFFFKFIKDVNCKINTVCGGGAFVDSHAYGSQNFKIFLDISKQYIDKIFIGPGEELLYKYLEGQLQENERVYINLYKENNKETDFIRIFDFSDFNMRKYSHLVGCSSISCPYKCSFCNEHEFWGNYKKRTTELVISEMKNLYNKYQRKLFMMTDSLLNPTIDALTDATSKEKLPVLFDTYFRIDESSCDVENTTRWRNGGLYRVRLGVESGSPKILELMSKKINIQQIKSAISAFAFAGIKTTTYWVIGHPEETEEDFQMTLDLIEELKNDIWQAECNVFQYFNSGVQNSDDEWAKASKPLYTEEQLRYIKFMEWELDLEPKREVVFERMHRFINHCKKIGVPNPYSAYENWQADMRWRKLHANAVEPLEMVSVQNSDISQCELNLMAAESIDLSDFQNFDL